MRLKNVRMQNEKDWELIREGIRLSAFDKVNLFRCNMLGSNVMEAEISRRTFRLELLHGTSPLSMNERAV